MVKRIDTTTALTGDGVSHVHTRDGVRFVIQPHGDIYDNCWKVSVGDNVIGYYQPNPFGIKLYGADGAWLCTSGGNDDILLLMNSIHRRQTSG